MVIGHCPKIEKYDSTPRTSFVKLQESNWMETSWGKVQKEVRDYVDLVQFDDLTTCIYI